MRTSLSLAQSQTNLRASCLPMLLQAEHRHAAGLIDLLFKRRLICFYRLLTSASKNPLLRKRLYNLCICHRYERLIIIILMPYKK